MLRASEMPQVEVSVVESGQQFVGGVGEPGVPPVAPAVANAYYRLTGIRQRNLPFFPNAGGFGGLVGMVGTSSLKLSETDILSNL